TLNTLFETRRTLQEHKVRHFGQQLVASVAHLHSLSLARHDLKPLNLLLIEGLVLKVGDFGQTQDPREGKELRGVLGSPGFQPPEVLKEEVFTYALDVFAIGAILSRMLLGVTYKLPDETAAEKKKPVKTNGSMSPDAIDLLQRTLESDPKSRITIPDLLAHPFLTDGPIPQSLSWDILNKSTPLSSEGNVSDTDGDCQVEEEGASAQVNVAEGQLEVAQTQLGAVQAQLEPAQTQEETESSEPDVDLGDVDLDDIFAEVKDAKLAKAILAEGSKKQKGDMKVAVCGGKKAWEDDSDDDDEEGAKDHKKVKVMQKGAVKAPENKEKGYDGDQDGSPSLPPTLPLSAFGNIRQGR
ncbi:hypothetical protein BGX30_005572, partial [Mortierella sp. GBA39]